MKKAVKFFTEKNPNYYLQVTNRNYILVVEYGLQKFPNQKPYFTITGEIYKATKKGERDKRYSDCLAAGCLHEKILKYLPEYADLVEMHLRWADGSPSYAVENGWYYYENGMEDALKRHLDVTKYPEFANKQEFADYIETLKPKWKEKADRIIEKYGLQGELDDDRI